VVGLVFALAACESVTLSGGDAEPALEAPQEIVTAPKHTSRIETTPTPSEPARPEPPPADSKPAAEAPAPPLLEPPTAIIGAGTTPVALLLPLSGPNAELGQLLLDAAQLALFDVAGEDLEIRPYDTASDPERTAEAARAATAQGAVLLLGPVFSRTTTAAAAAARERGIELVSYSNDRDVAGDGVYLMGLLPRQQIERIVTFANTQGIRRFAALIPDSAYGTAVLADLKTSLARTGGDLVAVENYRADLDDLDEPVRNVARVGPRNYDALLVPEGGDRLRAFAALLPYYNIHPELVRYVGTALWSDPTLGREPALVGGWFAGPSPELARVFKQRFAATYGRQPPRIASLVYDSVALAAALARQGNFSATAISAASGFAGIDGIFRFGASGAAERGLAVIEVTADGFRVVSEAPTTFQALAF
jgi:ABC-type branched-subunit amino acid transport system substrate-binding protein